MARRPLRPVRNPGRTLQVLLGLNILVFLGWQAALRHPRVPQLAAVDPWVQFFSRNFTVSLESVTDLRLWTLLTTAFSHVDGAHLLFNLLALWVFGREVLAVVGRWAFVHLYVVGALVASLGHVAWSYVSGDPSPALGASGSVMAIAMVFACLFPRRILLLNFFIPVPAALAVAGYMVLDTLGMLGGGSGIAHAAHLGGALYGFLFWALWVRPRLRRR